MRILPAVVIVASLVGSFGFAIDPGAVHNGGERIGAVNSSVGQDQAYSIDAPERIDAGTPTKIVIHAASSTSHVTLIVLTSVGAINRTLAVEKGIATLLLDSKATRVAGQVSIIARVDGRLLESRINILPGKISNLVDPILSPTSIIADGKEEAMAVAFPMDLFGNSALDGYKTSFTVTHADHSVETLNARTAHLLAYVRTLARTAAGHATISAFTPTSQGRTVSFDETAGIPVPFTLDVESSNDWADGYSLNEFITTPIADMHGNVMSDGQVAIFSWTTAQGTSRQVSKIIGGRAKISIASPDIPQTISVTANVHGTKSDPVDLSFKAFVDDVPFELTTTGNNLELRVGPVTNALGAVVRDATPVDVKVTNGDDSNAYRAQLVAGSHSNQFPIRNPLQKVVVSVTVLGSSKELVLKVGQKHVASGALGPPEASTGAY